MTIVFVFLQCVRNIWMLYWCLLRTWFLVSLVKRHWLTHTACCSCHTRTKAGTHARAHTHARARAHTHTHTHTHYHHPWQTPFIEWSSDDGKGSQLYSNVSCESYDNTISIEMEQQSICVCSKIRNLNPSPQLSAAQVIVWQSRTRKLGLKAKNWINQNIAWYNKEIKILLESR